MRLDISQNFQENSRREYLILRKMMKMSGLTHQTVLLGRQGYAGQLASRREPGATRVSKQVHTWVSALGTSTRVTAACWGGSMLPNKVPLEAPPSRTCHVPATILSGCSVSPRGRVF